MLTLPVIRKNSVHDKYGIVDTKPEYKGGNNDIEDVDLQVK